MNVLRSPRAPRTRTAARGSFAMHVRSLGVEPEHPNSADLSDLVVQIAESRSRTAFIALFQHFAPRVMAWLMRSGLDPAVSEEIAQETMLAVWRKADRFDPTRAAASTWIFTIARNLRIDRQRRVQRARAGSLIDTPGDDTDPSPSGEDLLISARRDEALRAALAALPPEQSGIIRLAFFNEWSHARIAEILGMPLGTVKSRIRRAMEQLRQILDSTS